MGSNSTRPEEEMFPLNVSQFNVAPAAEDLCETHGERLKMFCMDHQKPICVICRDSKDHRKHRCVPINEAAEDSKVRHC